MGGLCVLSIVPSPVSQPKIQVFSAANSTRSNSYDPFAGLEKKELGQNTDPLRFAYLAREQNSSPEPDTLSLPHTLTYLLVEEVACSCCVIFAPNLEGMFCRGLLLFWLQIGAGHKTKKIKQRPVQSS